MESPPADRDRCAWCGAIPFRAPEDDKVLLWVGGKPDCEHETVAGR